MLEKSMFDKKIDWPLEPNFAESRDDFGRILNKRRDFDDVENEQRVEQAESRSIFVRPHYWLQFTGSVQHASGREHSLI